MYHLHSTLYWKSYTVIGMNFAKWKLWRICIKNYTEKKCSEPVKSAKLYICWPIIFCLCLFLHSNSWTTLQSEVIFLICKGQKISLLFGNWNTPKIISSQMHHQVSTLGFNLGFKHCEPFLKWSYWYQQFSCTGFGHRREVVKTS